MSPREKKPPIGSRLAAKLGGALDRTALLFMRRTMQQSAPADIEKACKELIPAADFYESANLFSDSDIVVNPTTELAGRRFGANLTDIQFQTPYHPKMPEYVEEFASYHANQTVYAKFYQAAAPKATAIVVHGWGGGPFSVEELIFPVRSLLRQGFNVLLYQLPFHAKRAPLQARQSGKLFPSPHVVRTNETFGQIIAELRVLKNWLSNEAAVPVGFIGMSVGAYIGALWSSLDKDLAFCSAIIPVCNLADLMWNHGERSPLRRTAERLGFSFEHLDRALSCHCPLYRDSLLSPDRLHIIAGRGDEIATQKQTMTLWEHWGKPELTWFPGGHLMQIGRGGALRSLLKHLDNIDLGQY